MKLKNVQNDADIQIVALLAAEIWKEHYTPIIGSAQVDYMIEKFQSFDPIKEQIGEGYVYYLIQDDAETPAGYFSVIPKNRELFLSKLYVLNRFRRKGFARGAIDAAADFARKNNLGAITLTVNKNNTESIEAYRRTGFIIRESLVSDIGNGFVMDDYLMIKPVNG